jgi:hypothetical protein
MPEELDAPTHLRRTRATPKGSRSTSSVLPRRRVSPPTQLEPPGRDRARGAHDQPDHPRWGPPPPQPATEAQPIVGRNAVFGDEEHTGAPIELTQENPDHERHRPAARHRRRQPAHHRPPGSVPASRRRPGSEPGRASPTPHPGAWVPVLCTGSQHDWPPTPGCTPPPTPAATSVSRTATCHRGQGADRGRLPTGRSWPPPRSMPPARTSTSRCSPTPGPACYARSGSSARVAERLAVVPRAAGFATSVARGTQMRSASRSSRSTRSLRVGTTTALPATIIQPTVGHERRVQRCRDEAPTKRRRAGEPQPRTALPGRARTASDAPQQLATSMSPPTSRFGSSEAQPTWERTWARSSSGASRRLGSLCEAQVASTTGHQSGAEARHQPRPPPALLEQLPADEPQEPAEDACPLDLPDRHQDRCPQKDNDTPGLASPRTRSQRSPQIIRHSR